MSYSRVVIVGSGFGGLHVAKTLKRARTEVMVIDKTNYHLFQPLLYQVATASLSPGEIAYPIREIFRNQKNTTVIMGDVVDINKDKKEISLANGDTVNYDYLVLAVGVKHSYFGHDEWQSYAPGLKTIHDAIQIRESILSSFEKAERIGNLADVSRYLNFVIIGGGPTGVEMAGAIAEISRTTLFNNFRRIKPETARIYLVESLPNILPAYSEKLSKKAKQELEDLGVTVLTGKKVTKITSDGVTVEEQFIETENVIWAAGNQASPLLKALDVPLDKQGRVIVEPDLSIPNHPEVFVIGDAACSIGSDGKPLPGVAPTAIQQGKYVGRILKNQTPKGSRHPFEYFDKGSMATIGKGKAIATMKSLEFTGLLAWLAWGFVHILYLVGFKNRLAVLMQWVVIFLTGQRGVRMIYGPLDQDIPKKQDK
ncbi:MAG: NAD(P)/FAD-dependent oxidoreductase [Chlamydiae bacterium]|nr:NAD(P)/FAD-dependent oxidoreductase [Chlamydiota bacterium]